MALANGFSQEQLQVRKQRLQQFTEQISVSDLLEQLPDQPAAADDLQSQTALAENLYAANRAVQQLANEPAPQGKGFDLQQRGQRYKDVAEQEFRKQRGGPASRFVWSPGQSSAAGV